MPIERGVLLQQRDREPLLRKQPSGGAAGEARADDRHIVLRLGRHRLKLVRENPTALPEAIAAWYNGATGKSRTRQDCSK